MKDGKDLKPDTPKPDPVGDALAVAIAKAATPVDPYLALGVEVAQRMRVESALSAALDGLRAAQARIAELEGHAAK